MALSELTEHPYQVIVVEVHKGQVRLEPPQPLYLITIFCLFQEPGQLDEVYIKETDIRFVSALEQLKPLVYASRVVKAEGFSLIVRSDALPLQGNSFLMGMMLFHCTLPHCFCAIANLFINLVLSFTFIKWPLFTYNDLDIA